jgi:hypothetical protein
VSDFSDDFVLGALGILAGLFVGLLIVTVVF